MAMTMNQMIIRAQTGKHAQHRHRIQRLRSDNGRVRCLQACSRSAVCSDVLTASTYAYIMSSGKTVSI